MIFKAFMCFKKLAVVRKWLNETIQRLLATLNVIVIMTYFFDTLLEIVVGQLRD